MKIIVAGAAGLIVFHLYKSLLNKGYRVIGLDKDIVTLEQSLNMLSETNLA